jgi:hypothetical protein
MIQKEVKHPLILGTVKSVIVEAFYGRRKPGCTRVYRRDTEEMVAPGLGASQSKSGQSLKTL